MTCPDTTRALYHLEAWARWMRESGMRKLWYPSRASGGLQSTASQELEDMAEHADLHTAEVCDAVVKDLPRDQHMAIHHRYLRTAYTCADYPAALASAMIAVGRGLSARGVVYP